MQNSINQTTNTRYIKLDDYKVFDYEIPETFLDFVIEKEKVEVKAKLKLKRRNKKTNELILDGTDICIKKIYINESVLNENNYNSDDCNLILRTILNKAKRLLKIKYETDKNNNIEQILSTFKPPIFWKEKEIVKKQAQSWKTSEVKKIIYKINDLEIIVKKNSENSLNFISDFVRNY